MQSVALPPSLRSYRPGPAAQLLGWLCLALAIALLLIGPARLIAQVEGDRGILPLASTSDIEVGGIEVNVTGKDANEARLNGWRMAQRKGWEKLGGPAMADGVIESMVSAVVIEREQIGPRRYIATLGIIFDRARAGQYVGGGLKGARAHSAPMLVLPVLYSGGTAQVFEVRGPWQRAWASFKFGASPIDYVRPSGIGGESLLLTAGQPGRRSRVWWRNVLDQFGAADVLIPVARLERQWPGGPVNGTFTARYGPDDTFLGSFTLTAADESMVPEMLGKALVRLDQMYATALADGQLSPDPTLVPQQPTLSPALAALIAQQDKPADEGSKPGATPSASASPDATKTEPAASVTTITVQFASPDKDAVDAALGAVRSAPGVQGASTTSLAMGGISVMRVTFKGDAADLAAALRARGYSVSGGGSSLSIRK
jgi:hypothetical protein